MQPCTVNTKDGVEQHRINLVLLTFRKKVLFTVVSMKRKLAEIMSLHWQVQKLWNNSALVCEESKL